MRLAIDASRSAGLSQKTGVEVVSDEVLRMLAERYIANSVHEVTFYTPRIIAWLPLELQRVIQRSFFWTLWGLSLAMLRDRPDALLVPVHTLPLVLPSRVVKIIHDVSFLRHPEAYSLRERLYMRLDLWRAKRRCYRVIVPTEAVKQDLLTYDAWDSSRILVTGWGLPSGVGESASNDVIRNTVRQIVGSENPYILFIGRCEEKKNIKGLLGAFACFRKQHPEWRLVLAGKPGYGYEKFSEALHTEGVFELGYVSQAEKQELLRYAGFLALVSHEEGFGFPVLEAFEARLPVLASDIPVLREIAGDAAVYASAENEEEIAERMAMLADNERARERLKDLGDRRKSMYTWDRVADVIWDALTEEDVAKEFPR